LSKNPAKLDKQVSYIKDWIEELKQQRHRFELLLVILRNSQPVLDRWTIQYLELSEMKREWGLKLVPLPQKEKKQLEQTLGSKTLAEYEKLIDESISQLVSEGRILTIAEMETLLTKIDVLIVELITYVNQMQQGKKTAIRSAKEVILKKVMPICFGLALIGVDIPVPNWSTIIGGGYIIYTASRA